MNSLNNHISLEDSIVNCRRCRRLHNQFAKLRESHPEYWNKPVPPSGDKTADVLVIGLAPGMHGANKSGVPFTGDASGEFLFNILAKLDAIDRVRITNAVKCLPIKNHPNGREVKNCSGFLKEEIEEHQQVGSSVLLALGGVAHRAIINVLELRQVDYPFSHGAVHEVSGLHIVDSYHCSRYNTQTRRLTESMFLDVVKAAMALAHS